MFLKLSQAILFSLLLISCSSRSHHPDSFKGVGLKVGKVVVSVNKATVKTDALEIFNKLNGSSEIATQTISLLSERGLYETSSPITMKIRVTDFRLRHGALAGLTGMLSGQDLIKADVELQQGKKTLQKFKVDEGTFGHPWATGRSSRETALFRAIGKVALEQMSKFPVAQHDRRY